MTIVFIISAVFAGLSAGAAGGFMVGCMMASGGREDAFRAGYRAANRWTEDELKWGGDE